MLKIGLTGGIGSGKSYIADLFQQKFSIPVIDADQVARQVVEPGQPALKAIVTLFGEQVLFKQGDLDRARLRQMVFTDSNKKQQLENLLHPVIFEEMKMQASLLSDADYCLLSIPLLIETGAQDFVDSVLVVDCPVETQVERVKQRDGLEPDVIEKIVKSQVSRESRLEGADHIIDNSNNPKTSLAEQVKKLHNHYLLLSHS